MKIKRVFIIILAILMFASTSPLTTRATNSIPTDAAYYNGHSYKVYDESMSWTDAKAYCEELNGHLVAITSAEEQNMINLLVLESTKDMYWIGAYGGVSTGSWKWVTNEPWEYTNWSPGGATVKPDNEEKDEDYVSLYRTTYNRNPAGSWNDNQNNASASNKYYLISRFGFICEWDSTPGKVHSVSVEDVTIDYKSSDTILPVINADNDVEYYISFESLNPNVVTIDQNGKIEGKEIGVADIKVTVTDEYSNVVTVICTVMVVSHTHDYKPTVVLPTCTEKGYTIYKCSCGESYVSDYTDALGHDFGDWTETKAPTCTEKGEERRDCSRCDEFETREIEAKGHNPSNWIIVYEPTCVEKGLKIKLCLNCGLHIDEAVINNKPHVFSNEWETIKEPTYEEEGIEVLRCTKCREVLSTRSIPKLTQGRVYSVKIDDVSLNYKSSTTLKPAIEVDQGVKYTVKYESSNTKAATVDQNGNVTATKRGSGSATITCTVTDQYGNVVKDTCTVNVSLTFGQKIIVYILFGWIWY